MLSFRSGNVCNPHMFSCGDGHCRTPRRKCDGVEDCPNGADEILLFFTVKSPSVTQRSVSQENAYKKS